MSKPRLDKKMTGVPAGMRRTRIHRPAVTALAAASAMLLSACANRDSVTVGSVPDDYRTNHPIVIAEKQEVLDLAVGRGDRGMTRNQREAVMGFMARYDRSASPVVTVQVPSGAANDVAASEAAAGIVGVIKSSGVPAGRIAVTSYQAGAADVSAPVRISYVGVKAQTGKCGRWPGDMLGSAENKHYANFGCSYQNNLAAQIANPNDLLGPRKPSPIDAGKRDVAISDWQSSAGEWTQEVEY